MTTQSPPFNPKAERGILGCMLLEPEQIPELAARLEPEDFYGENHQRIFRLLTQMSARGEGVDLMTLMQRVTDLGMTEDVGGAHYLASLGDDVPAPALLRHYRDLVIRHASARDLMRMGTEIATLSATGDADSLADAEALLARGPEALQRLQAREVVHASDIIGDVQADIYAIADGQKAAYLRTGLPEWDLEPTFGGLSTEGVTLIIAASGMGKTTVLNSLAVSSAAMGTHTYIHGTETSAKRRLSDMAAALANVDRRAWVMWQRGTQEERNRLWAEVNRMDEALRYLGTLPLMITGAGLTVEQVCSRARNLYRAGKCGVMFADYLQDFRRSTGDGLRSDRGAQTDHASTTLKELAADIPIPVVVGAQVSGEKDGVSTSDKAPAPIPQMYDVQWSSKAHQDAEEVYALYRDDYYRDRFGDEWSWKGESGVVDVHSRKRRTGSFGKLELRFSVPGKWAGTRPHWRSQR